MKTIEKRQLEFSFEIGKVQFNHTGRYFLKLTVKSSFASSYSAVRHRKAGESEYVHERNEVKTDVIEQVEKDKSYQFDSNKFDFFLPKGFCKNDDKHDVFLLVEGFDASHGGGGGKEKLVGETKFAIYPRPNAPKVNIHALPGEDMYRATGVLTLYRTLEMDNIQMHCGRIDYTASLRELALPKEPSPVPTPEPVPVRNPTPTPTPPPARSPSPLKSPSPVASRIVAVPPEEDTFPMRLDLPLSPTPSPLEWKKVDESPRAGVADGDPRTGATPQHTRLTHVARPHREEIEIIVHGAANLPSLHDGRVPIPFCTVKTHGDESMRRDAQDVTHATISPTHSPTWEAHLVVSYDEDRLPDEVLVLNVADQPSKEILVTYRLSAALLHPFHQYHLDMLMPSRSAPSGVHLFVTLMRKRSTLIRDPSCPNYVGFEVFVQGVQQTLVNPVGPLIAVARIVPDYYTYKWALKPDEPVMGAKGLTLTTITFPSPHPSLFAVPPQHSQGYPQTTLPGKPPEQPMWNHSFMFTHYRDKATLFTPGAAFVIEFYQAIAAMSDLSWRLHRPLGYSSLLLNQDVYRQVATDGARVGLRVNGLPIQGSTLKTEEFKTPTIGMIVRLVTSERPDWVGAVSDPDDLPEFQHVVAEEKAMTRPPTVRLGSDADMKSAPRSPSPLPLRPSHLHQRTNLGLLPLQDGDLPSHDAIENILPDYQYIFLDPNNKRDPALTRVPDDLDKTQLSLLDYQMRELEKYRAAVHKMGQDILTLRAEIRDLEGNNSQLRRDLSKYNDSTRLLLDSQELDGLTKPELAARYVALKQKLTSQTSELRDYKARVQQLQNDLIKKNDQERDFLRMSVAHESQNGMVLKLQEKAAKVKKLEEAIRKQEKVIDKMERLLSRTPQKDTYSTQKNEALSEENKRLRSELDDLRDHNRMLNSTRPDPRDSEEKLELYEKCEKSDGRIRSLEKQLAENARKWGHEKSDLMVKLQEAEHGLKRTSPLDNYNPKLNFISPPGKVQDPTPRAEPRRYTKAPQVRKSKHAYGALSTSKHDPYNYD